ncbi:hypothetical protein [Pedococcus sp. 5OH_020]|uniref:hypothetical protein n=1 Tax=Pedococcus sp. 5OH_020 TaxID=2989814 RepID=UPI0022E9C6D7|nr:hypothetical protein [Pedococcus sp. 5OH_020]
MGPSTVLGGRYAVQRRLEQMPGAERWSAHDTTLERDVVVVCLPEEHPQAAATLDAARRAAGIDNHRLVRVLDVGRSDGLAFVVEESIHDAHTLAQLLAQGGGLPAEEVRRVAGETATALEAARARGLHHLRLTPHWVLRGPDGTVKVRGVATAAALAGLEDIDAADAARHDAVGVVALAYAALTSRWPLAEPVPGLEPAPHLAAGVPAPSEIAAGVPGDLDALCRLTLNDDEGPLTPGDFATQIAPWAGAQVVGLGGAPRATQDRKSRTVVLPVPQDARPGEDPQPTGPRSPSEELERTAKLPRFDPTVPLETPAPWSAEPTAPLPASPAGRVEDESARPSAPPRDDDAPRPGVRSTAAATASASTAAGAVGSALGSAGQAAGQAAGVAAQRVGTFARATADKAAARRAERQAAQERAEQRRISLDQALVEDRDLLDPPLPMLPPETGAAPTKNQSKLVLLIIAAFLAVATVLGFWGASRIGSNSHLGLGAEPTPRRTVVVTAPPSTASGTPSTAPTGSTSAAETFPILSATGYDPEGDGSERNGEAARVFDGNDSTFWSSEGYASASLGGLKKGVGVRLDLGQPRKVSQVTLVLPDQADVTVSVGKDRTRDGSKRIGSATGKNGTVTLKAPTAVDGQYVFVWFTKVSQVSDGRFRATLAEVSVS